jgi:hypothetical protein
MNPTHMTDDEFVAEMNNEIKKDENYKNGMYVKNIGSGYTLEQNGVELQSPDFSAMLSKAHHAVVKLANERAGNTKE